MDQKASLIKHIETYVDSSATPTQQNASVNSVATLLKSDIITIEYLVREMELYLTTTDHILRARGMLLLAEVLGHLQLKPLHSDTIHTLVGFFTERLTDWRALRGALVGCLALVRRKSSVGMVTATDAKTLAQTYLENLQVQSLGQVDRKLCFELLECLLDRYPESTLDLGDHLVYGFCEAMEGEKDPQCLMHVFRIVEGLARIFPDPAGPLATLAADLFEIIGLYFPIHYTHPKSEDVDISRDELSKVLMMAFSASPFFEPFAIPLLLEKLSSTLPLAKIDSLKYLSYCAEKYGPERIAKHAEAIWSSLKAEIYNFPMENVFSSSTDLSHGVGLQENEITKEALVLLQTLVSKQNYNFLNLVLQDEDVNGFINSIAASENVHDGLPQKVLKLQAVGRILSVLAKASTSSCNKMFEAVFFRLIDSHGLLPSASLQDALAVDSDLPYQRLHFSALYLCIEILGACRELAAASVQLNPNTNFVDDSWCHMLTGCSSSLVKTFISNIAATSNHMYGDAEISLRVKGLQILATFPGPILPVSTSTFDCILDILASVVTEKFNMTTLWKMSLNALVEIGKFLHEYLYHEKSRSYMSIVVERIIFMISLDDSTKSYPLVLEALSAIGSSGLNFMSKIVEGVQKTMSAKFSKFYADGNLKVAAELVQLLECYSNKLIPRYQKDKGLEGVPLRLAIDIWDQLEAAMTLSFCMEGKVRELLKATATALKLAVAMCSEEDQCAIVKKAFRVISSNELFSPRIVCSQLEGLRITQDLDGFTCRDEWLIALFSSVIIALRPNTQIPNSKAVVELLLTIFLKGHVESAQALGSIVNKMPLRDNELKSSSYFCLDDALELIFRFTMGSCRDYFSSGLEMVDNSAFCDNVDDCALFRSRCITGLAWIGKALLIRGHEKLKDMAMVFLKVLVSGGQLEASFEKKSLLERNKDVIQSLTRSAADAFHVFMNDSEDCLNRTFHATVRPLYKQRFFSFVMPILLSAAIKSQPIAARCTLYRAIGHVICDTPLVAVLAERKQLLPVLVDIISVLSEDLLNKDMIYNLLLVLSGLLMDNNGQNTATDNAHVIINCLTRLVSYPHKMLVRETAIQCLVAMSGIPHTRIYPLRAQVLRTLSKVLDDPKRTVRQEAIRCRQAWVSIV